MQIHTSKNTSVNSCRLPAVYNKVDWDRLKQAYSLSTDCPLVYDYGCGKYTEHIKEFLEGKGFSYVGYDKYWNPDAKLSYFPNVVICSNVLNVIDDPIVINEIQIIIRMYHVPFFITVWEGDKSGIGKQSKRDCWQANKSLEDYIYRHDDAIKNQVLTRRNYLCYIR